MTDLSRTAPRPRTGPLLFVPVRFQRVTFLKWLKRVHAWTGLWGALFFLCLGTSGFLLNHRSILKIDTGKPQEVSSLDAAVAPGSIRDATALDAWAHANLGVRGEGRSPPPAAKVRSVVLGRELPAAEKLARSFNLVDGRVTVSIFPGSSAVTVKREAVGVLSILKNLHLGSGLGVGWILLIDTIAGALITMSLTGVLLWSRLHGRRLLAAAIAGGSLLWALAAAIPAFGSA